MKEFKVGDEIQVIKEITEENIKAFSLLSGDINPIHLDDKKINKKYHKKKIAHGMYLASLFSALIGVELPGNGTIYISQSFNFTKPIYVGSTVKLNVKIKKIIVDFAILETNCYDLKGDLLIEGEAKVVLPEY